MDLSVIILILSLFSLSFLRVVKQDLVPFLQKAELQVKLNPVFCELDISIVDRLNSFS